MEWLHTRGRSTSGKSQGFIVLLAGLLVSLFAGILVTTSPVSAADAEWSGASLSYNGQTFSPSDDASLADALDVPTGSRIYQNQDTANQVRVIYFAPSQLSSMSEISAQYAIYSFTPPNSYTRESTTGITLESPSENSGGLQAGQSCDIPGIGWLVCPTSNIIAVGMDWLYEQLKYFLTAQPLAVSDTTSGMFVAWNIMLSIANVAFIIIFLVIIYSHITSQGISNYGIKKMLPRLILAAVMVNVSYYICAIAIDMSNIAGQAIQDLFISIRNTISTAGSAGEAEAASWQNITVAVLSGGAAVAGITATYSGVTSAAAVMLIPLLTGFIISTVVVLLVLAARQALIVILTIISPLAFVCYLLPGTEKWFTKWRDTFFTMLIFFPAFSAVFGGSQLAGAAILQNSTDITMAILGLAVQVAPLAIAPLILKLSGGLLNRFAGIVNNPGKGLVDRSRKLAGDWSQELMNRRSRANDNLSKFSLMRRAGRGLYHREMQRKERIENYQKMAEAGYAATEKHANLDKQRREIEHDKQLIDKQLELNWNTHLKLDSKALEKDLILRVKTDESELVSKELENRYSEFKGGKHPVVGPMTQSMTDLIEDSQTTTQRLAVESLRQSNAQRALNTRFAEDMLTNNSRIAGRDLLEDAKSIYEFGEDSALASAIATMRSDYGKSVEEGRQIVKHFELSSEDRQAHAMGEAISKTVTVNGVDVTRTFDTSNVFTREASIEDQVIVGTVEQVQEIVAASGSELSEFKSTISEALAKSSVKGKAPYMGGKLIDDVVRGAINSQEAFTQYVQEWIANGKYRPEDIAVTDPQGLKIIMEAASTPALTNQMTQRPGETTQEFSDRQSNFARKLASGISSLSTKAERVIVDDHLNVHVSEGAQPLLDRIKNGNFTP